MTDEELMNLAQKRAKAKQQFKMHLAVYFLVNVFLVVIFFFTTSFRNLFYAYFWPKWPIFGWGLGLALHGLSVYFNLFDASNADDVMKEYNKLKNNK